MGRSALYSLYITTFLAAPFSGGAAAAQVDEEVLREPSFRIGTADGDQDYLLFGAGQAVRLDDGRIVVINTGTNQFRIYDQNGRHLRTVGRRGEGPGEFNGLQRIGVAAGDTILAYDVWSGRLSAFSREGEFVRSQAVAPFEGELAPRAAGFTASGRMLAHTDFDRVFVPGERRDSITYALVDGTGEASTALGRYAGEEFFVLTTGGAAVRRPVTFGRNTFAAARGDRIVIGSSDTFRFTLFDASGRRLGVHSETRDSRRVQRADVRAADAAWLKRMRPEMRDDLERRIGEFPHRETYPVFEDLLVGADGSVWVQEYAVPGRPERRWTVFGPDGSPLRQVRAEDPLRVVDAGADWVLAWMRDEYDRESILFFPLPPAR